MDVAFHRDASYGFGDIIGLHVVTIACYFDEFHAHILQAETRIDGERVQVGGIGYVSNGLFRRNPNLVRPHDTPGKATE